MGYRSVFKLPEALRKMRGKTFTPKSIYFVDLEGRDGLAITDLILPAIKPTLIIK